MPVFWHCTLLHMYTKRIPVFVCWGCMWISVHISLLQLECWLVRVEVIWVALTGVLYLRNNTSTPRRGSCMFPSQDLWNSGWGCGYIWPSSTVRWTTMCIILTLSVVSATLQILLTYLSPSVGLDCMNSNFVVGMTSSVTASNIQPSVSAAWCQRPSFVTGFLDQ